MSMRTRVQDVLVTQEGRDQAMKTCLLPRKQVRTRHATSLVVLALVYCSAQPITHSTTAFNGILHVFLCL